MSNSARIESRTSDRLQSFGISKSSNRSSVEPHTEYRIGALAIGWISTPGDLRRLAREGMGDGRLAQPRHRLHDAHAQVRPRAERPHAHVLAGD
eukprot:6215612-Pyramimonas_sp.AAC.1